MYKLQFCTFKNFIFTLVHARLPLRYCKALLVTSSRVSSAIANTRPLPLVCFGGVGPMTNLGLTVAVLNAILHLRHLLFFRIKEMSPRRCKIALMFSHRIYTERMGWRSGVVSCELWDLSVDSCLSWRRPYFSIQS